MPTCRPRRRAARSHVSVITSRTGSEDRRSWSETGASQPERCRHTFMGTTAIVRCACVGVVKTSEHRFEIADRDHLPSLSYGRRRKRRRSANGAMASAKLCRSSLLEPNRDSAHIVMQTSQRKLKCGPSISFARPRRRASPGGLSPELPPHNRYEARAWGRKAESSAVLTRNACSMSGSTSARPTLASSAATELYPRTQPWLRRHRIRCSVLERLGPNFNPRWVKFSVRARPACRRNKPAWCDSAWCGPRVAEGTWRSSSNVRFEPQP